MCLILPIVFILNGKALINFDHASRFFYFSGYAVIGMFKKIDHQGYHHVYNTHSI